MKRRAFVIVVIFLVIAGLLSRLPVFQTHAASGATVVPATTPPWMHGAQVIGNLASSQVLTLSVTLQPRDPAGLQQFTRAVATPGSAMFRHFLTTAQFMDDFGPTSVARQTVLAFLQSSGLTVLQSQNDGLLLRVQGTAGKIAAALHIGFRTYRAVNGETFFANDRNITLPADVATAITGIVGLDDATRFHPMIASDPQRKPLVAPQTSCLSGSGFITAPQLANIYHFPQNANAASAHLALLELDGYLPADIATFAACYASGVNVASIVQPRLVDTATPLAAGDSADEDELDIEIALGLAPTIGRIDVYEAPNSGMGWIDNFAAIAGDNTDGTVSISWGACEADEGASGIASENVYLQQMVAQGQGVFASAGDTGAYDCLPNDGSGLGDTELNVDDPGSNPNVVAVGGTSLMASGATYTSETTWNSYSGPDTYDATGGGVSQVWTSPAWQTSSHATIGAQSGRAVPDVAADADPETGTVFYCSVASCSPPGWYLSGGTSAAAPTWAALLAVTNVLANQRVGLITPSLYALYQADTAGHGPAGVTLNGVTYYDYPFQWNGSHPSSGTFVFNDITTGNNSFPANQGYAPGYTAARGYDAVTGLGSMNGQGVANYLIALRLSGGPSPTPVPSAMPTSPPSSTPTPGSIPAGIYLAAEGSNGGYWVSASLFQPSSLPFANGNWQMLDTTQFQGAPALVNGGNANGGTLWIAGIGSDGVMRVGTWTPMGPAFGGWQVVSGATCSGDAAAAFAQGTLFVTCKTPSGGLVINAYNTLNGTWGGWATIGGGLVSAPTMATDGTNLVILAQAPLTRGDQSDWYTLYTVGSGATTPWRRFLTTCEATPAVAYRGSATNDYALSCIADDTSSMWANVFTLSAQSSGLSGWVSLGIPAHGVGFQHATAVVSDRTHTTYFIGQGTDNAMDLASMPINGAESTWQRISLPGIFRSNAGADVAGI